MKRVSILLALLVAVSITAHSVLANSITIDFSDTTYHDSYSSSSYMSGKIDLPHWTIYYGCFNPPIIPGFGYDSTKDAMKLSLRSDNGHMRVGLAVLKEDITVETNFTVTFEIMGNANKGLFVGVLLHLKDGTILEVTHYSGTSAQPGSHDGTTVYNRFAGADNAVRVRDLPGAVTFTNFTFNPVEDAKVDPSNVKSVQILFGGAVASSTGTVYIKSVTIKPETKVITFNIKDALSGQPLTGVTVKEGSNVLGTLDDGGTLELTKGTHTLTFEKSGYWSTTKTTNVQGDMTVSVEMYPSSAAFKLENFPSDISIPEHTIYTLTFTLTPINTNATYNTYLSLSGLSDIIEVRKDGSVISPEGGKYYLGDISSNTQVSIKFKATSVGTYAFSLSIESHDAFNTKTYTTTKQVSYKVDPLPFTVEMPSEWQVGDNQLRISESSGQSYAMVVVLKDSSGEQVWSDSYSFNPYDVHTFTVSVPREGTYTLEFQWAGKVASYTVNVGTGISLLTKSVSVKRGGVGTVQVQLKNPGDSTKYYTIRLEGGFLDVPVNQCVAVAPSSTKTVSISFAVPDKLTYDAYDLTLKVLEGDAERYSSTVHVIITGSEAGLPIGLGGGFGLPLLAVGAAAALGLGAVLVMRRR